LVHTALFPGFAIRIEALPVFEYDAEDESANECSGHEEPKDGNEQAHILNEFFFRCAGSSLEMTVAYAD
jgi:hypothetical protein